MEQEISVVTQSVVSVTITSSVNTFGSERRLQKDLTIADVKDKLVLVTGANPATMKIELYNKDNKLVCIMDNDTALLGSYPVDDGCRIHVVDSSLKLGEFEDVSKVEKFELSEEQYAQKTDSVRAFKERHKLGRFKEVEPEEQKRLEEEKLLKEQKDKEKIDSMKIGDRCEVRVSGQASRRGCVQYLGTTDFKPGYWVGIQYDEPVGKNDGRFEDRNYQDWSNLKDVADENEHVQGRQYFKCPPKYGGFVKPDSVEVGDFPEEGFEDMDEM